MPDSTTKDEIVDVVKQAFKLQSDLEKGPSAAGRSSRVTYFKVHSGGCISGICSMKPYQAKEALPNSKFGVSGLILLF